MTAAQELRDALRDDGWREFGMLDDALVAERRATVERITDAVETLRAEHPDIISREAFQKVVAILDKEAAR